MGRIVVTEFMSLDGVMEAPGGGEDFRHGGWTFEINRGDAGEKPYGWQEPKEWEAFTAWMRENKLIENVPDARAAFTNELLPGEGL